MPKLRRVSERGLLRKDLLLIGPQILSSCGIYRGLQSAGSVSSLLMSSREISSAFPGAGTMRTPSCP